MQKTYLKNETGADFEGTPQEACEVAAILTKAGVEFEHFPDEDKEDGDGAVYLTGKKALDAVKALDFDVVMREDSE